MLVVFVWLWLFDATNNAAVVSRCLINDNLGLFLFIRMFLANISFNFISSFVFPLILLQFQRIQWQILVGMPKHTHTYTYIYKHRHLSICRKFFVFCGSANVIFIVGRLFVSIKPEGLISLVFECFCCFIGDKLLNFVRVCGGVVWVEFHCFYKIFLFLLFTTFEKHVLNKQFVGIHTYVSYECCWIIF